MRIWYASLMPVANASFVQRYRQPLIGLSVAVGAAVVSLGLLFVLVTLSLRAGFSCWGEGRNCIQNNAPSPLLVLSIMVPMGVSALVAAVSVMYALIRIITITKYRVAWIGGTFLVVILAWLWYAFASSN